METLMVRGSNILSHLEPGLISDASFVSSANFFSGHFVWVFLFTVAWVLIAFVGYYYLHQKTGISFPPLSSDRIRFDERYASGRSLKNVFTRLGGASRCLHVTVTDTELWIRPLFPFNVFAQQFDLEHRISKTSISAVQTKQLLIGLVVVVVEFNGKQGQPQRLSLNVKETDAFVKALAK